MIHTGRPGAHARLTLPCPSSSDVNAFARCPPRGARAARAGCLLYSVGVYQTPTWRCIASSTRPLCIGCVFCFPSSCAAPGRCLAFASLALALARRWGALAAALAVVPGCAVVRLSHGPLHRQGGLPVLCPLWLPRPQAATATPAPARLPRKSVARPTDERLLPTPWRRLW